MHPVEDGCCRSLCCARTVPASPPSRSTGPAQFNALNGDMLDGAAASISMPSPAEPQVRVVVLAGAGRAFCPGHDLKEMLAEFHRSRS